MKRIIVRFSMFDNKQEISVFENNDLIFSTTPEVEEIPALISSLVSDGEAGCGAGEIILHGASYNYCEKFREKILKHLYNNTYVSNEAMTIIIM